MKISLKRTLGLAVVTALLAAAPAALGQSTPLHLQPASALVFPLFDSTPGAGTAICVTNTETSSVYCPNSDFREGDILVHYQYIAGDDCLEFDRWELLTPGDTLCVLADKHNPEQDSGFLVVSSADPSTSEKVVFDALLGSAVVVQSDLNVLWSYTPYGFTGIGSGSGSACDRKRTDVDGDGALDFDGLEYGKFPRELMLDSFLEETGGISNQLTLMSTAGQDYINEVNFVFWNNIEMKFSRTLKFVCWWSDALSEVSQVVTDLGGDEEEMGHPPTESGWATISGNRILDLAGNPVEIGDGIPPLLGVFVQFVNGTDFAAGHGLHYRGTLDGLEILNGDGI